jgi:hypothetical protein
MSISVGMLQNAGTRVTRDMLIKEGCSDCTSANDKREMIIDTTKISGRTTILAGALEEFDLKGNVSKLGELLSALKEFRTSDGHVSKELLADASGEVINNILRLIEMTCDSSDNTFEKIHRGDYRPKSSSVTPLRTWLRNNAPS